jgi:hypothetical protein
MKYALSALILATLVPATAKADYVLNDFETDKAPWSTGTISTSFATSGTHSLRLALPASDMWYCSSTIIDVTQYTTEQRQAAFTNATKLMLDFTVGNYTADWMSDAHVGFILQGTGAGNDWVPLGTQKWNGLAVTTTAEIPITPAQAAILASDPAAKLFLYADYGNGSSKGINLFVDTFRTDASSSTTPWYAPYSTLENGMIRSEWFGSFRLYEGDFAFHNDLKWLYCAPQEGWLIAYDFSDIGWLATSSTTYPYIYLYEVPSADGQSTESGWACVCESNGDGYTWLFFFGGSRALSGTYPEYPGWWRF